MNSKYKYFLIILRIRKILFLINHPKLLNFYLKGIVPSIEHYFILKTILEDPKIDAFFDIGSNKGQFTLLLKFLKATQDIYSFDPLPSAKRSFIYISRYLKNIKFYPFAISNKSGCQNFLLQMR